MACRTTWLGCLLPRHDVVDLLAVPVPEAAVVKQREEADQNPSSTTSGFGPSIAALESDAHAHPSTAPGCTRKRPGSVDGVFRV